MSTPDIDTLTTDELIAALKSRCGAMVLAFNGEDEDGGFFKIIVKEGYLIASAGLADTLHQEVRKLVASNDPESKGKQ